MKKRYIKRRLPHYHKIYEQIYENPSVPLYTIAENTGIARSTASRYLIEMYNLSIVQGPMIFVKPAQNYHEYACFLRFENPLLTYRYFKGFPHVVSRWLCFGSWNLLLICEKLINFFVLKGFKESVFEHVKGVTYCPKVVHLDWEPALKAMYSALSPPSEKTTLYEEIQSIPWDKVGWTLYRKLKHNTRIMKKSVIEESHVRNERYQKWVSEMLQYTNVVPAFYPQGRDQYFMEDFLFRSQYQKQLADILGMLPSSSVFFSVGEHLFARLSFLNRKEKDDLLSLIFHLEEEGFFTEGYHATTVPESSITSRLEK